MSRRDHDHDQIRAATIVNAAVGHDGLGVGKVGAGFVGIDRLVFGAMVAPDGLAEPLPQGRAKGDTKDLNQGSGEQRAGISSGRIRLRQTLATMASPSQTSRDAAGRTPLRR